MSRGGLDSLGRAWINAEAAKPHGYQLMGVARGPREVDPKIMGSSWVAWARSESGPPIEASGAFPEEALNNLAAKLRAAGSGGAAE